MGPPLVIFYMKLLMLFLASQLLLLSPIILKGQTWIKNILWTCVTSAGIPLPLPIDSCCSLSLVSKAHTEVIVKAHPTLKFTKLSTPLSVSVANPQAQLQAIGSLQVPIIWDNGRASVFPYSCFCNWPG